MRAAAPGLPLLRLPTVALFAAGLLAACGDSTSEDMSPPVDLAMVQRDLSMVPQPDLAQPVGEDMEAPIEDMELPGDDLPAPDDMALPDDLPIGQDMPPGPDDLPLAQDGPEPDLTMAVQPDLVQPPQQDLAQPSPDLTVSRDLATPPDLVPQCPMDGLPCTTGNNQKGLCKAKACVACTDVTDDANCNKAYNKNNMSPHVCLMGACTPGNCRKNTDCPGGQICGLAAPNTCSKCTDDAQCGTAYGMGYVCNKAAGTCAPPTCNVGNNKACPNIMGDVCCSARCVPGDCCDDAFCKTSKMNPAYVCVNNTCTLCDKAANNTYYVDPVNGLDDGATGSAMAGGKASPKCAFKTLTRALLFLGNTPAAGTKIFIKGPANVGAGESFPIQVPGNVSLIGQGGVTIRVPQNGSGLTFNGPNSGLASINLDGAANTALYGVQITRLGNVTIESSRITNFGREGMLVVDGTANIYFGFAANTNGTVNDRRAGLRVAGTTGKAIIKVAQGQAATTFNGNTGFGILVDGGGSVQIDGVAGVNGAGTVQANSNYYAGIWINQNPRVMPAPPLCSIKGVSAYANIGANGIRVYAGSQVKVRNSYILSNVSHGVVVARWSIGMDAINDVSKIDFGTKADPGKNTLQAILGRGQNQGTGLCMVLDSNQNQKLQAAGNIFQGRDCSAANPGKIVNSGFNACSGNTDIGIVGGNNDIDVTNCTY